MARYSKVISIYAKFWPDMVNVYPDKAKLCLWEGVNEAQKFLISYVSKNFSLVNVLKKFLAFWLSKPQVLISQKWVYIHLDSRRLILMELNIHFSVSFSVWGGMSRRPKNDHIDWFHVRPHGILFGVYLVYRHATVFLFE